MFDEFRIFSPGNKSMVLDVNGARIGVAICEDIFWQDGGPVAELAKENIDLLLTMNGSPYEEGKTDTRPDPRGEPRGRSERPDDLPEPSAPTTSSSTAAACCGHRRHPA